MEKWIRVYDMLMKGLKEEEIKERGTDGKKSSKGASGSHAPASA